MTTDTPENRSFDRYNLLWSRIHEIKVASVAVQHLCNSWIIPQTDNSLDDVWREWGGNVCNRKFQHVVSIVLLEVQSCYHQASESFLDLKDVHTLF